MKILGKAALCVAAGGLLGCGTSAENDHRFEGERFRTTSRALDTADRDQFQVTVRNADRSLEGARQAGYYEAVQYCVQGFGSSDIVWRRGPDDADLTLSEGSTLILTGRCATLR